MKWENMEKVVRMQKTNFIHSTIYCCVVIIKSYHSYSKLFQFNCRKINYAWCFLLWLSAKADTTHQPGFLSNNHKKELAAVDTNRLYETKYSIYFPNITFINIYD